VGTRYYIEGIKKNSRMVLISHRRKVIHACGNKTREEVVTFSFLVVCSIVG